ALLQTRVEPSLLTDESVKQVDPQAVSRVKRWSHLSICVYCCNCCPQRSSRKKKQCGFCCRT
uniref:Hepcidin n=1 Tax=Callorhinchus milii TaxID=7868 RepID=A0A4W3GGV6_CALMI